jgi:hypothetical protein
MDWPLPTTCLRELSYNSLYIKYGFHSFLLRELQVAAPGSLAFRPGRLAVELVASVRSAKQRRANSQVRHVKALLRRRTRTVGLLKQWVAIWASSAGVASRRQSPREACQNT